jgi:ubiquinone/menaquinone biosynthesis C-methylase UbiE
MRNDHACSDPSAPDFLPGAHFHFLTPLYELIARPMLGGVWRAVAKDICRAAQPGATVADFGCGPATVLRRVAAKRPDLVLVGVDIDEQMLAISRRRLPGARLLQGSVAAVPIEDASVDVVVSSLVFHHLPREVKQGAFREARRVLKPDGLFFLCDFSMPTTRPSAWLVGLFGKFESGVASQATGELRELAEAESFSIAPRWTRWGCVTQHEIRAQPPRTGATTPRQAPV